MTNTESGSSHASPSSARNPIVIGLSACLLGFFICPYLYIALGAVSLMNPAFGWITLPPLFVASAFVLWVLVPSRGGTRTSGTGARWLVAAGLIASGMVIAAFLFLISGFTLLTDFERLGLFATLYLTGAGLCLPVLVLRRSSGLEHYLARLPRWCAALMLVFLIGTAGVVMVIFLVTPTTFMG